MSPVRSVDLTDLIRDRAHAAIRALTFGGSGCV
jgi:hypothetical protein